MLYGGYPYHELPPKSLELIKNNKEKWERMGRPPRVCWGCLSRDHLLQDCKSFADMVLTHKRELALNLMHDEADLLQDWEVLEEVEHFQA